MLELIVKFVCIGVFVGIPAMWIWSRCIKWELDGCPCPWSEYVPGRPPRDNRAGYLRKIARIYQANIEDIQRIHEFDLQRKRENKKVRQEAGQRIRQERERLDILSQIRSDKKPNLP